MRGYRILIGALVSLVAMSLLAGESGDKPGELTRKELRNYSDLQKKLYPKKGDIYRKVIELFGEQDTYTAAQVTAATDPTIKTPFNYEQRRKESREGMPIDAFSRLQAQDLLARYEKLHPKATNLWNTLIANYGDHLWYRADELRDVEENEKGSRKMDGERPADDPVEQQIMSAEMRPRTLVEGFRAPRIRQSWRDVLYDDDRSLADNQSKVLKDLVGATVSYAHDGKARTDTWSANGAIIFPWERAFPLTGGITPARLAIAPSISVNRLDTNGDPKKEADSMLLRLGLYANWVFGTTSPAGVQVRAAPVYAADTGWRARLPGYEVDVEPRWQSPVFPLGYKRVLIKKEPVLDDQTDKSCLDYQLRGWLHVEGGNVQDNGKSWDPVHGSFFRIGPTAQLQINAPRLVWGKDFSVTSLYSYLPALSGSKDHYSFWKISAVLNLFKDEELNRKVSVNAEYQRGGLNLTKEDVNTFTIGLGVLF